MKKQLVILLLTLLPLYAFAQQQEQDSVIVLQVSDDIYAIVDTIPLAQTVTLTDDWRPDPLKATWLSVIIPSAGQIYNRSYWKLPIVYGAFMGCIYAITWNGGMYNDYKQAYRDILTDETLSTDPTRSYNAMLPRGSTVESMGGRNQYTQTLNSRMNLYRRYRDLSILATVAVYALTIIDAYVDAQLFDFEISPDLSLNIQPQIYQDLRNQQRSAEIQLAFTIK